MWMLSAARLNYECSFLSFCGRLCFFFPPQLYYAPHCRMPHGLSLIIPFQLKYPSHVKEGLRRVSTSSFSFSTQANTEYCLGVWSMLVQRRRRWTNIDQTPCSVCRVHINWKQSGRAKQSRLVVFRRPLAFTAVSIQSLVQKGGSSLALGQCRLNAGPVFLAFIQRSPSFSILSGMNVSLTADSGRRGGACWSRRSR